MANGLCTSCQGLQRVIDQWRKRDELDRHRADAAEAEIDRLRAENAALTAEVAQLDAICRWNRERIPTMFDEEFGIPVGGLGCEHPSLTCDRCDACGWKEADR